MTLSGTTMTFYEDGNKIAEKPNVTLSPKDIEATIANYIGKPAYPSDQYFKGQISDFRLYNRALSANEIKNVWVESLTDSEAVQAVKDGLNLGDTAAVIGNLTLPTTYAAGVNVTWSSDRTDIIAVDGKVTRPSDANTTVHLTASISKGSATDTKTITVTVLKAGDVVGLDSQSYVLFFNQTHGTKVTVTHPNGSVEDMTGSATYESSDSNVAKVEGTGMVTGLHTGTAVIKVTYKGETYQVTVTVMNDMLLWYKLDETSGTFAADSSGNGNDGVLKNGATWGQGIGGSSLQLSGGYNGAYVQMPNNLLQGVDDLTISAFMKMDATATAPQWLATFSNTKNGYIYFAPTLSGRYRYSITPTNWSGESGVASSSIPVSSWRQVAVTYSSLKGTATLYVDGVAVQTNAVSQKPSSLEPTDANFIGKPWPNYGDPYFKGNVSDFRLYRRALNTSEIQAIYESKLSDMFITDQMNLTLGDTSAVQGNLTLPTRGSYGSAITWTSSNETVINSQTGAVTRPAASAGNATVMLTATIRNGRATATKTFTVTVIKQLADVEKLKHDAENLTVHNIDDVRGNLTLPVKGEYGSVISWSSEDPAVVAPTGEVKRPATGTGDVEIKLTATLRLNDEVLTKAFLAHVKMLPAKSDYAGYLFAYFIGEGTTDGEQLYLSSSNGNDPLHWNNLNSGKPVFTSHLGEKGVRDPSIVRSPDGDKFYMIATDLNIYNNGDWTRAQTTGSTSLLIWESSDLIHWSNQRLVKVSSDLAGNTWAPEAFYDKTTGEYVVFWASKIYSDAAKSGSPNERIMYAKTRDFYTFTEAKEYYNPGYSVIDTTMIDNNGKVYRFTKDERDFNAATSPNGKMVFEESSDSIFGNFTMIKEGIGKGSIPAGEGPLVFKANGENKWYLFIDYFSGGGYKPFYTTDLASGIWTPVSSGYSLPTPTPRHGTVLPITAEELARINGTLPVEVATAVGEVTNVTLDQQVLALKPGQTAGLKATVVPDLAGNKTVLWSSSNESVAIVNNTGTVTANGSGTAAITATTVDGGRIATAQITVQEAGAVPITGVSLNIAAAPLQVGGTTLLEATVTPGNATNKTVRFTSTAPGVASVTNAVYNAQTGTTSVIVTGVSSGTALIVATTEDGSYTAASAITVELPSETRIAVTGVSLNKTSASLQVGGTTLFEAVITPDIATNKTVRFSSSAPGVATVTNAVYNAATGITSVIVTGISRGTATITAKTADGDYTAISLITVEQPIVSVTGVTLDKTAATLEVGGTVLLKSSITPSNATNKAVRFTSSVPGVATVTNAVYNTETGTTSVTITGVSSGNATITATTVDGGMTAAFTVTVTSSGNGNTPNPTGSPDTPKEPEAPVSDIPGKVKIGNPVVETGTAKVTVDTLALNKAFKGSAVALIEVPKTAGVNLYAVNLPASSLTANDGKKVVVATEIGTIAVPSNMLGASAGVSAADVALSIGKADISRLDAETKAAIGSKPVIELNLKVNGSTVAWSNPEAPVLVSIPYTPSTEELANPEHITVWYVDGNGRITAVPTGKYDSTTEKVTFMTTHFSKYAVAYVHKSFRDLADYSWAKNAIEVMASKGVIQGTSNDIFKPGEDITRADFVQLLVRTLGLTAKTDDQFADISSDAYYAEALAIARKLGIATGVGGNQFSPDSMIIRQDIMVLIERALKEAKKEIAAGSEDNLSGFADRSEVASYAKQSVSSLIRNGIINGDGSGINPLGNATRAETAVLMYRIYNK